MGNFAGNAPESIADRYKGGVKIYLESDEDVAILGSKWFFALKDRCAFESADQDNEEVGGGCRMVIKKVEMAREAGLDAYGIVDRDILLAADSPDALRWETDDASFASAKPFGDYIHVLRRWEIENYLLHPKALAHLVSNKTLSPKTASEDDVARALVSQEEDLITVTLLSVLTVPKGIPKPNDGFGKQTVGAKLKGDVLDRLECGLSQFNESHQRVKGFAEGVSNPTTRWDKLSRMLDGKRVFHRLGYSISELKGVKMSDERGTLADIIKNLGLIDPEFEAFLYRAKVLN